MRYTALLMTIILISCGSKKDINIKTNQIVQTKFQSILDSNNLMGSILIYDLKKDTFYSNNYQWAQIGRLPASTFKITNSIIALELGIVSNDSMIFKWNGEKRALKVWEQDLNFKQAFHYSCVPCYQDIARGIGANKMKEHLQKYNYGNMIVDSSNIDLFWLQGESKINQFQQIDFLKRFYNSTLEISQRTESMMKKLMIIDNNTEYTIRGKTGWAIRNKTNNGWFVGYLEKNDNTYFFATNISPLENSNLKIFPMLRKKVTMNAFKNLNIIEQ